MKSTGRQLQDICAGISLMVFLGALSTLMTLLA